MKVLMVRSNPIDPDIRIEKEAKTLGKAGYNVTILGWNRFGNAPTCERKKFYSIFRINFKAPIGKSVLFYLPLWWIFEFYWLIKLEWDIIHAADFDTLFPALIVSKIKKKKIIYDIFDFYADEIVIPKFFRDFIAKFDSSLMKFVHSIIVVDYCRLNQIGLKSNVNVEIIFNTPTDYKKDFKFKSNEKSKKFTLFYAGVLTEGRDFTNIFNATDMIPDIHVEIAGFGPHESVIKKNCSDNPKLTFLGRIPYSEVIERTINSDLLFALYDPKIPNNRFASPNKLFEAMMCQKPILVSEGTAMEDIIRKEKCGLIIPYNDLNALLDAIKMLKSNPSFTKKLGENGRLAFEREYNWHLMEKRLLKIYRGLVNNNKNNYSHLKQ